MKKYTLAACLALVMVFALGSFASDLPRMAQGNSIIHGGGAGFNKAALDTINLMAACQRPHQQYSIPVMTASSRITTAISRMRTAPTWNGWTH